MAEVKQKVEILRVEPRKIELEEFCASNEAMQASPLLTRLDAAQRKTLLENARVAAYAAGERIDLCPQGRGRLGLVLLGSVSLQSSASYEIAVVNAGEFFGLEAIFQDAPRLMALAGENLRLAWLEAETVRQMARRVPSLESCLRQRADYLRRLTADSQDFLSRW